MVRSVEESPDGLVEIEKLVLACTNVMDCKISEVSAKSLGIFVVVSAGLNGDEVVHSILRLTSHNYEHCELIEVSSLPRDSRGDIDDQYLDHLYAVHRANFQIESLVQTLAPNALSKYELVSSKERAAFLPPSDEVAHLIGISRATKSVIRSLPQMLEKASQAHGDKGITFVEQEGKTFLTYRELYSTAQMVGANLTASGAKKGAPAIIQVSQNSDYIKLFWGCQFAGIIPVAVGKPLQYSLHNAQTLKIMHIIKSLGEDPTIICDSGMNELEDILSASHVGGTVLDIKTAYEPQTEVAQDASLAHDVAVYLLTSGSTSMPKLVPQTHERLIGRCDSTVEFNSFTSEDVSLNCFPLEHVCGLVMFHLRDVHLGAHQIHASTEVFTEHPLNWMRLCSDYAVTVTWAPNFAFNLVSQASVLREVNLDLSHLRMIENCAESVVPSQCLKFLAAMEKFGLKGNVIKPAWGMSETSSVITLSNSFSVESVRHHDRFAKVGRAYPGVEIKIVDETGTTLMSGEVGLLFVRGNSVFEGYHNCTEENSRVMQGAGWFNTEDLAMVEDGELVIVGRQKEIIIVNGSNYSCHEIEMFVDEISGVAPSYTAAFAMTDPQSARERVCVSISSELVGDALEELVSSIKLKICQVFGFTVDYIFCLPSNQVPKTPIGKIQREKIRALYHSGAILPIYKGINRDSGFHQNDLYRSFERVLVKSSSRPAVTIENVVQFDLQLGKVKVCYGQDQSSCTELALEEIYEKNPQKLESIYPPGIARMDVEQPVGVVINLMYGGIPGLELLVNKIEYLVFMFKLIENSELTISRVLIVDQTNLSSQRNEDSSDLADYGVVGFVRSLSSEGKLDYIYVDIDTVSMMKYREIIGSELGSLHKEPEIVYNKHVRYCSRLQYVEAVPVQETAFKKGGVYVIAGGSGGLGLALAKWLIDKYNANIYLLGRRQKAAHKDEKESALIQLLNRHPGRVSYVSCDITDHASSIESLKLICESADKIEALFNLAAELTELPVAVLDRSEIRKSLAVKVEGTRILASACSELGVKYLINFSSVNGYFGGAFVSLYSAANAYQESFSRSYNQLDKLKVINVSWSMWDNIGLSVDYPYRDLALAKGYEIIEPEHGFAVLEDVVCRGLTEAYVGLNDEKSFVQVHIKSPSTLRYMLAICGTNDDQRDKIQQVSRRLLVPLRFNDRYNLDSVERQSCVHSQQEVAAYDFDIDDHSNHLSKVVSVWQDLGVNFKNENTNIFDAGATSILVPRCLKELNEYFGLSIRPVDLFTYSSPRLLAAYIESLIQVDQLNQPVASKLH